MRFYFFFKTVKHTAASGRHTIFESRPLPSAFNDGVVAGIFSTGRNIFHRPGNRQKNGDRCLRILIVSTNIITVLSTRAERNDGHGFDNRQMVERMAEINAEKVSSIKTIVSLNHRPEIILKARVNILPPVAHRTRSPRIIRRMITNGAPFPLIVLPSDHR